MQPLTGSGSVTKEQEKTNAWTDDGDHERYSHYAPADAVTQALVMGSAVMALCGKVWVPHRDPYKYQVCPTCKEIYEGIDE